MILINPNRVPFFTVIMCTFNRAHIIKRALDSLLDQEETDWECIIVDDGSSDNTKEVIAQYLENPKFRYMYHKNKGLPLSRNVGILAAAGLYVTFLDTDDYYLKEHLKIRKQILQVYKDIDLLHGSVDIIGNKYVRDKDNPRKQIHLNDCAIGGTFVINRIKAIELGGFNNLDFADDADFYDRAYKSQFTVAKTDVATYVYDRTSPDSICNKFLSK